jgi:phosphoribosyl-ATP pyrophosphohydrolase
VSKRFNNNSAEVLERLFAVVKSRKGGDVSLSYTAKLFDAGMGEITRKVGEEAVETITAAFSAPENVIAESADLLYHLLVLWAEMGIQPANVWAELERREGISGVNEKAERK